MTALVGSVPDERVDLPEGWIRDHLRPPRQPRSRRPLNGPITADVGFVTWTGDPTPTPVSVPLEPVGAP